jgi:hypothetical protein
MAPPATTIDFCPGSHLPTPHAKALEPAGIYFSIPNRSGWMKLITILGLCLIGFGVSTWNSPWTLQRY